MRERTDCWRIAKPNPNGSRAAANNESDAQMSHCREDVFPDVPQPFEASQQHAFEKHSPTLFQFTTFQNALM